MTLVGVLCAAPAAAQTLLQPVAGRSAQPPAPWQVVGLPGQSLPLTQYRVVDLDGRRALAIEAHASYGNLVHPLAAGSQPRRLSWRWRVDRLNTAVDLRTKQGDDSSLKVCVLYDMPLSRVPFLERQVLRLARAQTGEPLPAATVCYVWDAHLSAGTVLNNPYSARVRVMVLRSGTSSPPAWASERRDIAADFLALFGDESPEVPPVLAIAVGADADNTQGSSLGYLADIALEP